MKIRERLRRIYRKLRRKCETDLEVSTTPVMNWVETRITEDTEYVIGIDTYPDFYSAHWITGKKPSDFCAVLGDLGVEGYSHSSVARKSQERTTTYKYFELKDMKDVLDKDCAFLRVESGKFTAIWSYEEAIKDYLVAFVSEKRNIDYLFKLYERTARKPRTEKVGDKILAIIAHYKE